MKEETFVMVSMEDSKTKSISDVLGSKTCKKIIDYLAKNVEASQKDLSDALNIPMNTINYNMKKLISSGFVQKRKNFFWSKKGKKIVMYELSNKSIVISPKKAVGEKFKLLIPGFMLTLVGTFAVWVYERVKTVSFDSKKMSEMVVERAGGFLETAPLVAMDEGANQVTNVFNSSPGPLWFAFMIGGLTILFLYALINWRKLN